MRAVGGEEGEGLDVKGVFGLRGECCRREGRGFDSGDHAADYLGGRGGGGSVGPGYYAGEGALEGAGVELLWVGDGEQQRVYAAESLDVCRGNRADLCGRVDGRSCRERWW